MAKILLFYANQTTTGNRPVSISILSAVVRKAGHEFRLFDSTIYNLGYAVEKNKLGEDTLEFKQVSNPERLPKRIDTDFKGMFINLCAEIDSYKPDIIGINCLSDHWPFARKVAMQIKKAYSIPIIFGGIHALVDPEIIRIPEIDIVCEGEGEYALVELLNSIDNGKIDNSIKNLIFKINGEIIRNEQRPLIQNFDDLPFLDWSDFHEIQFWKPFMGKVYRNGDFVISRGCPSRCTYCINQHLANSKKGQKYGGRRKSLDYLMEELKTLVKEHKIEFIKFWDETFIMGKDYLTEFSKRYSQEIGLPFTIETTGQSITEFTARKLAEANCVSASIGLETGSERLRRDILGKNTSDAAYDKCFEIMEKYGIRKVANFMFYLPTETEKDIWKNVEVARKWKIDSPCVGILYPYKATKIRDMAIKMKYTTENELNRLEEEYNPYLTRSNTVFKFDENYKKRVRSIYDNFSLFQMLPEWQWSMIERANKGDEIAIKLKSELRKVVYYKRYGDFPTCS